jgi:EAL domain-containing protein (putative c-di-GMP-specific phosphodiesterase class I)
VHQAIVVDDDEVLARVMQRVLARSGWEVHVAHTPAQALRVLGTERLDVAVVDYDLAHQDGIELLRRFLADQPGCVRILATARRDFPVDDLVNGTQVARVLRKPFGPEQLLATVDDALASAQAVRRRLLASDQDAFTLERIAVDEVLTGTTAALHVQLIVQRRPEGGVETVAREALLRPQHAQFPTPILLLEACERHGRVGALGSLVFRLARPLLERIPASERLFVNLHPQQLGDPDRLVADLEPLRAQAHRVGLEITERCALHEVPRWEESVAAIAEAGFALVVDDLGAGANGLMMLSDLQPAFVKLDMRLVQNLAEEARKQRLVHVVAQLGDVLGYRVVGEGVETEADARALEQCGVAWMQGWFFGRPVAVS